MNTFLLNFNYLILKLPFITQLLIAFYISFVLFGILRINLYSITKEFLEKIGKTDNSFESVVENFGKVANLSALFRVYLVFSIIYYVFSPQLFVESGLFIDHMDRKQTTLLPNDLYAIESLKNYSMKCIFLQFIDIFFYSVTLSKSGFGGIEPSTELLRLITAINQLFYISAGAGFILRMTYFLGNGGFNPQGTSPSDDGGGQNSGGATNEIKTNSENLKDVATELSSAANDLIQIANEIKESEKINKKNAKESARRYDFLAKKTTSDNIKEKIRDFNFTKKKSISNRIIDISKKIFEISRRMK